MKKLLILCLGFIPFAMILQGSQAFLLADQHHRNDHETKLFSGLLEGEGISFGSMSRK